MEENTSVRIGGLEAKIRTQKIQNVSEETPQLGRAVYRQRYELSTSRM
jgi:hypothetical protein